jgi:prepilin-type N-terminal cleavage/methylation domain-containing protein
MTRQSPHHDRPHSGRGGTSVRRRRSFTLIELLITVSIIAIMASMVLFAVYSAQEQAKVMKTRALIAKLNNIVRARYDSYRTRRAPIAFTRAETRDPRLMAKMRLDILRTSRMLEITLPMASWSAASRWCSSRSISSAESPCSWSALWSACQMGAAVIG